jgi:hypothetical protein
MMEEWPNRITVFLLQLELLSAKSPDDVEGYASIVLKMIAITQLTETAFMTIVGKIHTLVSKKATGRACVCLDNLISTRLLTMDRVDWLEQAIITRLWLTIQDRINHEERTVDELRATLDTVAKQLPRPLSPKATHAAQILLWKVSETFFVQESYQVCSAWCGLALHVVFDKSGELNCAKISR